jgi:hypothetical protein
MLIEDSRVDVSAYASKECGGFLNIGEEEG